MNNKSLKDKLGQYLDAGFPIIYMNTFEEDKADRIIKKASAGREIFEWNETYGFIDFDTKTTLNADYSFNAYLDSLKDREFFDQKIIVLKDIHSYLDDPQIVSKLKNLANRICRGEEANIIIVSSILVIPKELEQFITIFELDYLSEEEIEEIIRQFISENELPKVNPELIKEFASAFKGLTEYEIINLLSLSYAQNGELNKEDLKLIFEQKQQMIKKAGILEMIPCNESIDDIGGLDVLKDWLIRKAKIFKDISNAISFGVDTPKGVLIAGVPGCGKSLNAKAAANLFDVPLLRLDMGRLMGKYVGESESNMRRAIALAEAISPCILWVDELEKAFAGIGSEGGGAEVTTRLFGSFLTWLQEKKSQTFVVATANNILKLPPELLRKGRFDEIFYVGLPSEEEKKRIFNIHIKKRRPKDLELIDIERLVKATEGFSGADIEGVVKEAVETAFTSNKGCIDTECILEVIKNTNSLSQIMGDSLVKMKEEYKNRKLKNASR